MSAFPVPYMVRLRVHGNESCSVGMRAQGSQAEHLGLVKLHVLALVTDGATCGLRDHHHHDQLLLPPLGEFGEESHQRVNRVGLERERETVSYWLVY